MEKDVDLTVRRSGQKKIGRDNGPTLF